MPLFWHNEVMPSMVTTVYDAEGDVDRTLTFILLPFISSSNSSYPSLLIAQGHTVKQIPFLCNMQKMAVQIVYMRYDSQTNSLQMFAKDSQKLNLVYLTLNLTKGKERCEMKYAFKGVDVFFTGPNRPLDVVYVEKQNVYFINARQAPPALVVFYPQELKSTSFTLFAKYAYDILALVAAV